jgi:cobaltochelatase CobN
MKKRVALVLANYPNRDGRLANGVGLDTPAGTIEALRAMADSGFPAVDFPADGDALIDHLKKGPTNAVSDARDIRETISLNQYRDFLCEASESDSGAGDGALGCAGGRSVLS